MNSVEMFANKSGWTTSSFVEFVMRKRRFLPIRKAPLTFLKDANMQKIFAGMMSLANTKFNSSNKSKRME